MVQIAYKFEKFITRKIVRLIIPNFRRLAWHTFGQPSIYSDALITDWSEHSLVEP